MDEWMWLIAGVLVLLGIIALVVALPVWLIVRRVRSHSGVPVPPVAHVDIIEEKTVTEDSSPAVQPVVHSAPAPVAAPRSIWSEHDVLVRFVLVAVIGLFMLVPLSLIDGQAQDRGDLRASVTRDIAATWGQAQELGGPTLVIPVTVRTKSKDDGVVEVADTLVLLPKVLQIGATINTEIRTRGIYESVVYTAPLQVKGTFDLKPVAGFLKDRGWITPHYDQAYFSFGLSQTSSLRDVEPLMFDGQSIAFAPGARNRALFEQGFHAPVAEKLSPSAIYPFEMTVTVKGSEGLRFLPLGEQTSVQVSSAWPHPSFQGNALPDEHQISESGFSAHWTIPNLTRNYQQIALSSEWNARINEFTFGVDLFEPVKLYGEILRATKYGILFIALTFALFLANELHSTNRRLHPVQYGMVGVAMSLFYLLLLALAEHMPFLWAYILASLVAVAMNGVYVGFALRAWPRGIRLGIGLALLHALLFTVLRMEDYSLLMGTVLLLITVGMLMHATRRLGNNG